MSWQSLPHSYDTVASRYTEKFVNELDFKPRDRELLTSFANVVGDPVLEVGCGPGQIGHFAKRLGRRVVGIDLSRAMTALARARLDAVATADMRALPIADASVGGVLAFYSIIHLRRGELGAVLHEFRRILRPRGRLLLSVHEGDGEHEVAEFLGEPVPFIATLFKMAELEEGLLEAGFSIVHAERRLPYPEESTVRLYVEAVTLS